MSIMRLQYSTVDQGGYQNCQPADKDAQAQNPQVPVRKLKNYFSVLCSGQNNPCFIYLSVGFLWLHCPLVLKAKLSYLPALIA